MVNGRLNPAIDAVNKNTYVVTPGLGTLGNGSFLFFIATQTSDNTVTIQVDGSIKKIYKRDGTTQLGAGDISANAVNILVYSTYLDGGSGAFTCIGV